MGSLFFFFLLTVFCQAKETSSGISIQITNPILTKKDFSGSGHSVTEVGQEKTFSRIPERAKRDRAFQIAHLESEVLGMDALDKDMFYMRAEHYSSPKLQEFYPKIAVEKLKKLKEVVAK